LFWGHTFKPQWLPTWQNFATRGKFSKVLVLFFFS
jgi:hypothetical protein